jgi:hypothetical protein
MAAATTITLIDSFMYNGEAAVAALRLQTMYPHVDRIYITEADQTFAGTPKPEAAATDSSQDSLFAPYRDKIRFLKIDAFPPMDPAWEAEATATTPWKKNKEAWWRQAYQRNWAAGAIARDYPDRPYVVIVSDVDEIVRPALLEILTMPQSYRSIGEREMHLEMSNHVYGLQWAKGYKWYHAFVVTDRGVAATLLKQSTASTSFDKMRFSHVAAEAPFIKAAGWHLSYYAMTVDEIVRKIESSAYRERDRTELKARDWLEGCIVEGRDVFGRKGEELVASNETLEMGDIAASGSSHRA